MSKLFVDEIVHQSSQGSGTITLGASGETISIPSGVTTTLTDGVSGDFKMNSGYGSVATAYGVRAWVNFNGTGTVAIQDSGNVSSVADNGTGVYTINFSSNFPDVNYCHLSGGSQMVGVGNNGLPVLDLNSASNKSVSSFKMIFTVTNSARDNEDINMAFLR